MKLFNQDEIAILAQAEKYFYTTTKLNYKSATPIVLNQLVAELYDTKLGEKHKYNFSCSKCMFDLYKNCGTLYYKSKEYYEKKALEAIENNEVVNTPTETKKKAGRPRKTTNTEE